MTRHCSHLIVSFTMTIKKYLTVYHECLLHAVVRARSDVRDNDVDEDENTESGEDADEDQAQLLPLVLALLNGSV